MNTISFPKMFNNNSYKTSTNLSYNYKSIHESLTSLFLTSPGELLGDPAYGCAIKEKLFDVKTNFDMNEIRNIMIHAINKYIPQISVRASDIKIYSNPNNNKYKITLAYRTKTDTDLQSYELVL